MNNPGEPLKTNDQAISTRIELELKELELRVKELDLKVKDLEIPIYKRPAFWTSTISVIIAIVGIGSQSFISHYRNERAQLELARAKDAIDSARLEKEKAGRDILIIEKKRDLAQSELDSVEKKLDKVKDAFNSVLATEAYSENKAGAAIGSDKTKTALTQNSSNIASILSSPANNLLLKSSRLTVLYVPKKISKAITIDSLLKKNGVTSKHEVPNYDITKVVNNEIVYYNEPQLVYCMAVKQLLEENGYKDFNIRLSSGANATYTRFKIYVVR